MRFFKKLLFLAILTLLFSCNHANKDENKKLNDVSNVSVKLKLAEETELVTVENGKTYKTYANEASLVIESSGDAVIKNALIAGTSVAPTDNGKKATKTVSPSNNIEVKVEFEKHKPINLKFNLEKGILLSITNAKIYTGDVFGNSAREHSIQFNNSDEMAEAIELDDIEYSTVKLVVNFDANLKSAKILQCTDERSETYATEPTATDLKGVFSGAISSIVKNSKEEKLKTIDNSTYTAYLIAGYGEVSYKIQFEAEGKGAITRTIKIKNKKVDSIGATNSSTALSQYNGYTWQGVFSGEPNFKWLGYTAEPIDGKGSSPNEKRLYIKNACSNPEYMGDNIAMQFQIPSNKLEGELAFFYSVSDDRNNEACHEFVMIKGYTQNNTQYVWVEFDPDEKYVDAFLAFKNKLPLPCVNYSLQNKWKKLVEKGFFLRLGNETKVNNKHRSTIFESIFTIRTQAKTYGNNQLELGKHPLKIARKQSHEHWISGEVKTLEDGTLLTGIADESNPDRDIFVMIPTFKGKVKDSIKSFKYTITKEGSEEVLKSDNINISDNTQAFVIGGSDKNIYIPDDYELKNRDNIYVFEKGNDGNENIYRIKVEVETIEGKKEQFDFIIDYKNEQTLKRM